MTMKQIAQNALLDISRKEAFALACLKESGTTGGPAFFYLNHRFEEAKTLRLKIMKRFKVSML